MILTGSHPREWMTTEEWADYTMTQTTVYQLVVYGCLLIIIGLSWTFTSMSGFVVESADGVLLTEGGLGPGFIYGPLMAVVGTTLLSVAMMFRDEVGRVLSSARHRRIQDMVNTFYATFVASTVLGVLTAAFEAGDDR